MTAAEVLDVIPRLHDVVLPSAHTASPRASLFILEDHVAVINMTINGCSQSMGHDSHTHRVDLDWHFDQFNLGQESISNLSNSCQFCRRRHRAKAKQAKRATHKKASSRRPTGIQIKDDDTNQEIADFPTNGSFSSETWSQFTQLFNLMTPHTHSCSHFKVLFSSL